MPIESDFSNWLKETDYEFLAKMRAAMAPLMLCQTLKMAPGIVAMG